jgi:hypothetical protein
MMKNLTLQLTNNLSRMSGDILPFILLNRLYYYRLNIKYKTIGTAPYWCHLFHSLTTKTSQPCRFAKVKSTVAEKATPNNSSTQQPQDFELANAHKAHLQAPPPRNTLSRNDECKSRSPNPKLKDDAF